jgi:hypothetical protein
MTEAAAIEETVNAKMISTLLVIYRVAHRATIFDCSFAEWELEVVGVGE